MHLLHHIAAWSLKRRLNEIRRVAANPAEAQQRVFKQLLQSAANTAFGREYGFGQIKSLKAYQERVPVQPYEGFFPYIERTLRGEANVLWPGKTTWFAKSSGTTNDKSKFIPVTNDSLQNCHYKAGRDMLALYLDSRPDSRVFTGKSLSIGGTHQISHFNEHAKYGDISAVLTQNLPSFFEFKRAPSLKTALMSEWEAKIDAIAKETVNADIRGMAGVPTWTIVLIQKLFEMTGKRNLLDIWPNLEVFFHGAVSFVPYRAQFNTLIAGKQMAYRETYNASEGFFAVQDDPIDTSMLLLANHGIFYEFVPIDEADNPFPRALTLDEVELDTLYALVLSTNGGLWRYAIGDTVKFTRKNPYRLVVAGRTKHFINAFGEEVVVGNADRAIATACEQTGAVVADYTACPIYFSDNEAGGHEWLIEFRQAPADIQAFMTALDNTLKQINSDYEAKRHKNLAIRFPIVHVLPEGSFYNWMKSRGKAGGQNKVPRLSNDRTYVEGILAMVK